MPYNIKWMTTFKMQHLPKRGTHFHTYIGVFREQAVCQLRTLHKDIKLSIKCLAVFKPIGYCAVWKFYHWVKEQNSSQDRSSFTCTGTLFNFECTCMHSQAGNPDLLIGWVITKFKFQNQDTALTMYLMFVDVHIIGTLRGLWCVIGVYTMLLCIRI